MPSTLSQSLLPGPSPAAAAWPATEAITVGGGSGLPVSPTRRWVPIPNGPGPSTTRSNIWGSTLTLESASAALRLPRLPCRFEGELQMEDVVGSSWK